MIVHAVLFTLAHPERDARTVVDRLAVLGDGRIRSVRGYEVGANQVVTTRSMDVAVVARFDDLAGLNAYLEHPEHRDALADVGHLWTQVRAADFTPEPGGTA